MKFKLSLLALLVAVVVSGITMHVFNVPVHGIVLICGIMVSMWMLVMTWYGPPRFRKDMQFYVLLAVFTTCWVSLFVMINNPAGYVLVVAWLFTLSFLSLMYYRRRRFTSEEMKHLKQTDEAAGY